MQPKFLLYTVCIHIFYRKPKEKKRKRGYSIESQEKKKEKEKGEEGFQKSSLSSEGFPIIISTMSSFLYTLFLPPEREFGGGR